MNGSKAKVKATTNLMRQFLSCLLFFIEFSFGKSERFAQLAYFILLVL
jgi:hypothetical protein